MDPRDRKSLEDRALWILRHADQAEPREPLHGMALQLRLWQYLSSGMHVSWSIILPVREYRGRGAIVREAAWDRTREWKRKANEAERPVQREALEPSVRIRDAELGWEDLSPFLDAAGGFRPAMMERAPIPDARAGSSGLEGSRSFAHVCLEWTGRAPRGLGPTVAWFGRFRKLLVRTLRNS
jgi:hypothetical protein